MAELPELVTMNRMYRGRKFRLVTISLDEPDKKAEALCRCSTEHHVSTTNYLLTSSDKDKFAEALDKQWPGPVPYTMVIAPGGKVIYRKDGGDRAAGAEAGDRGRSSGGRTESNRRDHPQMTQMDGDHKKRLWILSASICVICG